MRTWVMLRGTSWWMSWNRNGNVCTTLLLLSLLSANDMVDDGV